VSPKARNKFMTANWRVILRAHQSGATSDCCEYNCACRLAEGKQTYVTLNTCIVYVVLVMMHAVDSSEASIEVSVDVID
jgi:hypothetical protein